MAKTPKTTKDERIAHLLAEYYQAGRREALEDVLKIANKLRIELGQKMAGKYRQQGVELLMMEIRHIKNKGRKSEEVRK